MQNFLGLLLSMSLFLLAGCGGAGDAAKPTSNENASASNVDTNGSQPVTQPTPPQPSVPTPPISTASPGDIVAASVPDPSAQYSAMGQALQTAPDPKVEPNSDIFAPIIRISAQPKPYIPTAIGSIQFQAADDLGGAGLREIQCNIDGVGYQSCSLNFNMSDLTEGLHTVMARAIDWDGNQSTEVSYTFYVDLSPPSLAIASAPAVATKEVNASFQFLANDSGSGVAYYQCRIESQNLSNCNEQTVFQNLSEGSHALYVRAVDNVGNQSPTTTYNWVVDNSPPLIQVVKQPQSIVYIDDANPVVNFNLIDSYSPIGLVSTCTLNGVAVACPSGSNLIVPTTTPGSFTLVINASDALANATSTTISWQVVNEAENRSTVLQVGDFRPVDILFIVDNSGSMAFERSNLAQRIDGMISTISDLDWQIAITSTDATNNDNKSDGKFIELIGMPGNYILDSNVNMATAQSVFGNTVQNFGAGSGNEEGVYVAKRVIDRYIAKDLNHAKFIRPGADLSIVILSDEDENSNGQNIRTTPQAFINYVNSTFNGQKNMVFHSIITRPGDSACLNGQGAAYGTVYDELSRLTGFGQLGGAIIGSVCDNDYTSQLRDIGQSVKDLKNSIKLQCLPFDADKNGIPEVQISYRKNAQTSFAPYMSAMTIELDRVVFDNNLPPGEFKADYKCKIN